MGEAPMTAADVGAVLGNRGNAFGDGMGGGFWIFALLILAFMGNGGWGFGGNRGNGDAMTTAEACNMNSFNELKSQVGRMNDMQFQDQTTLSNAICTLGYQGLQHKDELSAQLAAMQCSIEKEVAAQNQATRDLITVNKMECMQNEINNLKDDIRMANVVRYPNQYVYATGNPFFNCNNNGCCNTLF